MSPSMLTCPGCGATYPVPATLPVSGYARCGRCKGRIALGAAAAAPAPPQPADVTDRTMVVGRVAAESPLELPPGTRLSLAVLDGPDKGRQFPITRTRTVIGRREGEIRLTDPEVSGRHAVLTAHAGGCTIEDLQSTNGTFVNGARVPSAPVSHLDEIRLGRTRLLLSLVQEAVEPVSPAEAVEEQPRAVAKRLLLVEGSDLFRRKLLAGLKGLEGVAVEVAGEAGAAMAALQAAGAAWDLLLVDLHLPAGPEGDLLAALRASPPARRAPLVGMVGMVGLPDLLQLVAHLIPVALLDKAKPVEELRASVAALLAPSAAPPLFPLGATGLTVRCTLDRMELQGLLVGLGPMGARLAVPEVPAAQSELHLMFILPEVSHLFRIAGWVRGRHWPRPGVPQGVIDVEFRGLDPEDRSRLLAFLLADARRRTAATTAEIGPTG